MKGEGGRKRKMGEVEKERGEIGNMERRGGGV
jgi:hypothetical protein